MLAEGVSSRVRTCCINCSIAGQPAKSGTARNGTIYTVRLGLLSSRRLPSAAHDAALSSASCAAPARSCWRRIVATLGPSARQAAIRRENRGQQGIRHAHDSFPHGSARRETDSGYRFLIYPPLLAGLP
jgi:hypothetical protein